MMKRFLLCVGLAAATMIGQSASADVIVTETDTDYVVSYTVEAQGLGDLSLVAFAIDFNYFPDPVRVLVDGPTSAPTPVFDATGSDGFTGHVYLNDGTNQQELLDLLAGLNHIELDDGVLGEEEAKSGNYVVIYQNTGGEGQDDGDGSYSFQVELVTPNGNVEAASQPLVGCAPTNSAPLQTCLVTTVPEPASMGLMGLGFAGFLLTRRKFK